MLQKLFNLMWPRATRSIPFIITRHGFQWYMYVVSASEDGQPMVFRALIERVHEGMDAPEA